MMIINIITLQETGDRRQTDIQLWSRHHPHHSPASHNIFSKVANCASSWGRGTWKGGGEKALTRLEMSSCRGCEVIQAAPFHLWWVHPWQWRNSGVAQSSRRCQERRWGGHQEKWNHYATRKLSESEGGMGHSRLSIEITSLIYIWDGTIWLWSSSS